MKPTPEKLQSIADGAADASEMGLVNLKAWRWPGGACVLLAKARKFATQLEQVPDFAGTVVRSP
jgi:hypothetical protein